VEEVTAASDSESSSYVQFLIKMCDHILEYGLTLGLARLVFIARVSLA
jgi:hypothetical protein